jgi:hypothetical protein
MVTSPAEKHNDQLAENYVGRAKEVPLAQPTKFPERTRRVVNNRCRDAFMWQKHEWGGVGVYNVFTPQCIRYEAGAT